LAGVAGLAGLTGSEDDLLIEVGGGLGGSWDLERMEREMGRGSGRVCWEIGRELRELVKICAQSEIREIARVN